MLQPKRSCRTLACGSYEQLICDRCSIREPHGMERRKKRSRKMDRKELLDMYKSLFDTRRFEVNSRNFAPFPVPPGGRPGWAGDPHAARRGRLPLQEGFQNALLKTLPCYPP